MWTPLQPTHFCERHCRLTDCTFFTTRNDEFHFEPSIGGPSPSRTTTASSFRVCLLHCPVSCQETTHMSPPVVVAVVVVVVIIVALRGSGTSLHRPSER